MTTPCRESVSLGAYLLGALDPAERAAVQAHVADCPDCRRELLELAPLPGLLRHTPFEELPRSAAAAESPGPVRDPLPVDPLPLEPLPLEPLPLDPLPEPVAAGAAAAAADPPARGVFRSRTGRLVTAAAVLAAVAAGVTVYTGVNQEHRSATPVAAATWSATDPGTHVTASAAVIPEVWGTEFQLRLAGLPSNITCRLVVHGSDGRSETAGTWGSGYAASASVPASTSIVPSQITRLDVVSGSGTVLVEVPPG
ncbi:anti-sigma factor [Streptacidiphilus sp. P02-A3a]|uniref:anti-sigma factor family protein n=1 Tax=Streptacidiphilus sp. P02-A3a TaxID=2704468 RepID=UPI0015FE0CD5|nr:zf-HC2 domain-containing protein [Streptacidiphilus sp. P02-A3a]QMU72472.1 zf-HC2 domain-containing protein [Streptacidiphilus sp. P02-A3a]